uniref:Reverse transcriptase domain-containing protein n=1 Tax=Tanacetum cinerariifolium TaxID=118510 RepID=A0A699JXQ3_TANCI|nr:hypothetical protein [Tanacetum cinerariifolium]
MVIIVRDVLFFERNLRKICLHIVLKMEFSKILSSHPMTIPMFLMLFKSHSLSNKTPVKIPHKVLYKSTTIVVTGVVIRLKTSFAINVLVSCVGKIPVCYDDDDDEDYTIAITPKEPDNSLMTTSHFMMKTFRMKSIRTLFFNEEIISMKIAPHHFNAESDLIESQLNHGSPIISSSSEIDSFFVEFAGELTLLKSISPGINETDCDPEEETRLTRLIKRLLYDNSSPRPPEEFIFENSDAAIESFSPSPIPIEDSDSFMKEIDLSFTLDDPMPPRIKEDDYDSERDILILEELLSNDSFSLPENKSFHFDIPSSSRPPAKPSDGNSRILNVKVMGDISEHKVAMPRLMLTQPTLIISIPLDKLKYRGIESSLATLNKRFVGGTPCLS